MGEKIMELISVANRFDISDYLDWRSSYFLCGYGKKTYFNYSFAMAIEIIGKNYGDNRSNSNYHKGIAYIADELNITKAQVKSLRKKIRVRNGYEFKTPFTIPIILNTMIELLSKIESNEEVKEFAKKTNDPKYRNKLINLQYDAIRMAAIEGRRKKVLEVEGELATMVAEYKGGSV